MLGNFKVWIMKKKISLLWPLLAMVVVCACSKNGGSDYPDPEKAGLTFSLKKELGIAKVICKPPVLVPKTAQKSYLSKLGEMAHV